MTTVDFELDESQRAVAEAPADARLLVVAGAGQGKTEVVASRIAYLVDEEALSASTGIMVLSFSRAAVQAVRTRLAGRDIATTDVRTFDSLAAYLISQSGVEPVGSFDHRVRQATKLLESDTDALDELDDLEHVILDEVQDLVGDRAEMVLALLARLDESVGFTCLGDPLQGIYDFTLEDSHSKRTSSEFMAELTGEFGASVVALEKNYRARGDFPRAVVDLGHVVRDKSRDDAAQSVTRFEYTLPHSGEVMDWGFLDDPGAGRTAVLCATNGEVLRVSRFLTKQGISHVVRRPAQDFGAAPWIARIFEGMAGPEVARSDVEAAIEAKLDSSLQDEAWYLLKGAEGRTRTMQQLNLPRLRSLVSSGSLPLTLTEPDNAQVIVSTVHRAKGLEFDRVFFVHPNGAAADMSEWPVIRQRYVALSRARDEVAVIDVPGQWSWFESRDNRQRERKKSKQGKKYTFAIEFGPRDVRDTSPVPNDAERQRAMQVELTKVRSGALVTGVFDSMSPDGVPIFVLRTASGAELGVTSDRFGNALDYEFGYRFRDGWDGVAIDGLRLVSVETAACDPHLTEAAGLGPSGFWLVPRVLGLVTPER
ncbi:ATP-dependent helicase [Gordonia metallireducens]|uniref:ATP-dependent helicase n=1 Tax=Gordonia metallireducens TaxID=2897779 RepID=UPI001E4FB097|nr:ATP-dependent helicase [Gordonia metallireducens]